jgi:hypothetical protein
MVRRIASSLALSLSLLTGCAALSEEAPTTTESGADEELKQAECPAQLTVEIDAPTVTADDKLVSFLAKSPEFASAPDPQKSARDQVAMLAPWLAAARATGNVSLKGTVGKGCFYKTTDAAGKDVPFSFWLAKSLGKNGTLSLRVNQFANIPAGKFSQTNLFYSLPLDAITKTRVTATPGMNARLYAQETHTGHDGPEGFSEWIGSTKIKVAVAP